MSQYQLAVWLVLLAGSQARECRVVTGPDGLCAFVRLEPARSDLRIGTTLRVRVNGSTCSGRECLDCGNPPHRVSWRSTAPEVADVDSTGLVRAKHVGSAEIRLEPEEGAVGPTASMQVVVIP